MDEAIAIGVISTWPAKATATVRAVALAACMVLLVTIPDATLMVQLVRAGSVALPAVSISVALAVPELAAVATKVVLAHPVVLGTLGVEILKSGNTILITSLTLI